MKIFKRIALIFLTLLAWTAFVGYGFMDGFLLRSITSSDSPEEFVKAAKKNIEDEFIGNLAMVIIENGKIADEFFYSADKPINGQTVFPVASISKWVTSFGILRLVEEGKLELDKPINSYLTRWKLPASEFDNTKVTVRKLLSHSSGLIDDLGYNGFSPSETIQTIEESLTKAADGGNAYGKAEVGYEPGSMYMYSGAGYTLLQLLIEEISGLPFQEYMEQNVLEPLKMTKSTFEYPGEKNPEVASIYKVDGTTRVMNKFTALAAAGLYTTPSDLTKFLLANVSKNNVLSAKTIQDMSKAETFIYDTGVYGLGPHLYSQDDVKSLIIGHDGSGNNAINTAARIDLKSKSGIVVLETGNWSMASALADEWIFWKAGIADYVVMQRNKSFVITLLIAGYVIIVLSAIGIIRKKKRTVNEII